MSSISSRSPSRGSNNSGAEAFGAFLALVVVIVLIKTFVFGHNHVHLPAPSKTATIERIETAAHSDIGQPLWAKTIWKPYVRRGFDGCSAAESYVLWQAGIKVPGSDNVLQLAGQLVAAGWEKISITSESQMKEGDVIYGSNSEPDSHIGFVGSTRHGVRIYDNNSVTGKWGYHTIAGGFGDFVPGYRFGPGHLWVLRYEE